MNNIFRKAALIHLLRNTEHSILSKSDWFYRIKPGKLDLEMIAFKTVKHYYQKEFAVRDAGRFAAQLGSRAFIVGGQTALDVAQSALIDSLGCAGVASEVHIVAGYPCVSAIDALAERYAGSGADLIVGVGGGKAMDIAKGIAYRTGGKLMLIPTSASQCACFADLIVLYAENGDPLPQSWYLPSSADVVVADTDILARKCPVRMFAAGIADSMAKLPEIEYTRVKFAPEWNDNSIAHYAYRIVQDTYRLYLESAEQACADVSAGSVTRRVEDIITANFMLTGITSALANGCRNIALPHNIYYALCRTAKPQQKKYLHGEIVSAGITAQWVFNGADEETLQRTVAVLEAIHAYTTPRDLGLDMDEAAIDRLMQTCLLRMPYFTQEEIDRAKAAMRKAWL